MPWREALRVLWPDSPDSPRGRVVGLERGYLGGRAGAAFLTAATAARLLWWAAWPADRFGSVAPWFAGTAAAVLVWLFGFCYYRSRGEEPRP